MTGHVWDAYVRARQSARPGPHCRLTCKRSSPTNSTASGQQERADIAELSKSLRADLTSKGITFIDVDQELFRTALAKTTFYSDWKTKFGEEAWGLLEASVGKLG